MEVLQARIDSFKKPRRVKNPKKQSSTITVRWPHPLNFKANPETLGAAGFFYNPSYDGPDSVTCYFCDKELEGWEEVDDPHVIHWEKCGQTCCWAIVRCGLLNDMDKSSKFVFTDKTRVPTHKSMEKARFDTFDVGTGWIHDQVKNHSANSKMMARAGFVYTPQQSNDDLVTCLYCDTSLSGWDADDDPMEEHRKRKKSCPFFSASEPATRKSSRPKAKASKGHEVPPAGKPSRTRSKTKVFESEPEEEPTTIRAKPRSTSRTTSKLKPLEESEPDVAPIGSKEAPAQSQHRSQTAAHTLTEAKVFESEPEEEPTTIRVKKPRSTSRTTSKFKPLKEFKPEVAPIAPKEAPAQSQHQSQTAAHTLTEANVFESEPEEEPTTIRVKKPRSTSRTTSKLKPLEESEPEVAPIASKEAVAQSQHQSQTAAHTLTETKVFESEPEEEPTTIRVRSTSRTTSRLEPLEEFKPEVAPIASKEAPTQSQHQSQMAAHTLTEANVFESEPDEGPTTIGIKPRSPSRTISRLEHLEESEPEVTPITSKEAPAESQHQSQMAAYTLTEAELDMTVEEWIRYQMDVEYDKFRRDGERELQRFRNQAEVVRKTIEGL